MYIQISFDMTDAPIFSSFDGKSNALWVGTDGTGKLLVSRDNTNSAGRDLHGTTIGGTTVLSLDTDYRVTVTVDQATSAVTIALDGVVEGTGNLDGAVDFGEPWIPRSTTTTVWGGGSILRGISITYSTTGIVSRVRVVDSGLAPGHLPNETPVIAEIGPDLTCIDNSGSVDSGWLRFDGIPMF
jgi:hypothetical protein